MHYYLRRSGIRNIPLLKIILLNFVFLVFSYYGQTQENKKVHITGNFPDLPGVALYIIPLNIYKPLNKGHLDIWIDNIEEGVYPIIINYPLKPRSVIYAFRDNNGKIRFLDNKHPNIGLSTNIYINPNQAREYLIKPVKGMTAEKIQNFKRYDNLRSDLFGLDVISSAGDTKLYKKLAQLDISYNDLNYFKIMDSLYKKSTVHNKIYSDFDIKARALNYKNNYAPLLKAKRDFALKHPESPIAALSILDVDSLNLAEDLNVYEQILDIMSGRAKESTYYEDIKLKIQNFNGVQLKEGGLFASPSGKTPDLQKLVYNPSDFKYTLVEFWASWCAPCRAKNPEWNKILSEYKSKGFIILGISLDQYLPEWQEAIKKDSLNNWIHVCDLEYPWTSSNALKYGIQAIPFSLLLDSRGYIIKKNIDSLELKEFLIKNLYKVNLE